MDFFLSHSSLEQSKQVSPQPCSILTTNMSSKLIVVVGATGLQGGSVARHFAKMSGWKVRGITRNPDKPSNAPLRDLGIDLVFADLNDPASLDKAFQGANVIFANTDFWQFLNDPSTYAEAEKQGRYPNQIAEDLEVQQGKNAADAAARHAGTLDRFVWSTLSDIKKWSKGEFAWNLHFNSKAAVTDYIKESHPDLAAKTSYLQVGMYLQNWKMNPGLRPKKESDGTFTMNIPKDMDHYIGAPLVDPSHDTGFFVEALVREPAGANMIGCAKSMTFGDLWRTWAKIQGVELKIQDREIDFGKMPEFLAWEFKDGFNAWRKLGFAGGDPEAKGCEELGVDMNKLTDIEEWVRKEDFSSLLEGK